MPKALCNRCKKPLDKISYVEPDWKDLYRYTPYKRPPLCKECWEKVDAEARYRRNRTGSIYQAF